MRERGRFNGGKEAMTLEDRPNSSRSISQILQEIVGHVGEIVRSEIRLATTELRQDLTGRAKAATYLAIGSVLLFYGGGFVLLGLVYAMATAWPAWLSAMVVGAVVALLGTILFATGRGKMKQRLRLDMTSQTAEDNLRWLKNQAR
jgi:uncharacterized membrane protein YqjE